MRIPLMSNDDNSYIYAKSIVNSTLSKQAVARLSFAQLFTQQ